MQKTIIFAILISSLFLFGCLDNIDNSGSSTQYSAYSNNQTGFSTVKPNDWTVTEQPGKVPLTIFKPAAPGVTINIMSMTTTTEITPQSFFSGMSPQQSLANQGSQVTNVKLVEESQSQITVDNQKADRDVKKFSYALNGVNSIGYQDIVFVKRGDRYIIAMLVTACSSSDAKSCDQLNSNYEQVFSKVIESIKFI